MTLAVDTSGISIPQQTSSAHAIALNDDLLTEILHHLPVKSLIKFKSVSKHWLFLISHPYFSRRRNPYPNPISGLFLRKTPCGHYPDYKFIPLGGKPKISPPFRSLILSENARWITILQSCNGLLCCSYLKEEYNQKVSKYCIYNPTTQQFTILPKLCSSVSNLVASVGLAFDPCKSLHYKVICVARTNSPPYLYLIEIYSSETGWWRQSGDPFPPPQNVNFRGGVFWNGAKVFWNGAIHWITDFGTAVRFDVNEERLQEMPMPEIHDKWKLKRIKYFGESRDHLHLILITDPPSSQLNVYEMEKDYSRWFVKYHVRFDEIPLAFRVMNQRDFCTCRILCLVREENEQESFLVLHTPGRALCYSLKYKILKRLCNLDPSYYANCRRMGWWDAYDYTETLACVR